MHYLSWLDCDTIDDLHLYTLHSVMLWKLSTKPPFKGFFCFAVRVTGERTLESLKQLAELLDDEFQTQLLSWPGSHNFSWTANGNTDQCQVKGCFCAFGLPKWTLLPTYRSPLPFPLQNVVRDPLGELVKGIHIDTGFVWLVVNCQQTTVSQRAT